MRIRANRTADILFRALLLVLYTCFFFVQFHARSISAREYHWQSAHPVTAQAKAKTVAMAHSHSHPTKQLNKRFELQPALIIAALVFLIAITFFVVKKQYDRRATSLYTATYYCSALRGPPAIALHSPF
ncbi:MAG: hypothetical protein J7539_12295 [Niabella sp.]|nr:hypothetical protein [Niabella sp.]